MVFAIADVIVFLIYLFIVFGIPIAYFFFGWRMYKWLSRKIGNKIAISLLAVFIAAPFLFWIYEWSIFMSRCISAAPFLSTHSKTKFNGLAFDSGYPGNLTHHFGSDNRDSSSYKFTEFKLDLSLATHNNGGKLVRRCYGGLLKRCDDVENFQAEYMVRGGDIQPVQGLYGQYESVLQVLRIKDNQVTAERRVSLFGGGVLGIYFGFFGQSQYLACNAGETNTYWWFGGGQQADGHEQNEKLEKRDVQFILSFVEYEP